jgi:uncharacterized iron-regulated membrane protein
MSKDLFVTIIRFTRYAALVLGGICLVVGLVLYIRSKNDERASLLQREQRRRRASLLQRHCDNLSSDLRLLSEEWKA